MNDDEVRQLRSQLRLLQRRLRRESLPVPGLSRTLLQVLSTIARLPPGSQPRQLADELRMTSSNVAAALRELQTAGLIRREKDAGDARRVLVSATEKGAGLVSDFQSERDTWLGQAIEGMLTDDEQHVLLEAGRLIQRLAQYEHAEVPLPATPAGGPHIVRSRA
jgi:DNA-binding MarR family transcriptional regulator